MVGDGADAQAPLAVAGGVHIQSGGFHLQSQNSHLLQAVDRVQTLGDVHMVAVEHIGGVDVANMVGCAMLLAGLDGLADHVEVADGSEGTGQVELLLPVGVGGGSLADDDVIEVHMILDGTGGAHTDDVLDTKEVEQLMGIDADGGHAHAGGHDGDLHTLIVAGVALNTTDVVHQNGVLQEILCNKLGTQRIAGHQNSLAEADLIEDVDMRGRGEVRHNNSPLSFLVLSSEC